MKNAPSIATQRGSNQWFQANWSAFNQACAWNKLQLRASQLFRTNHQDAQYLSITKLHGTSQCCTKPASYLCLCICPWSLHFCLMLPLPLLPLLWLCYFVQLPVSVASLCSAREFGCPALSATSQSLTILFVENTCSLFSCSSWVCDDHGVIQRSIAWCLHCNTLFQMMHTMGFTCEVNACSLNADSSVHHARRGMSKELCLTLADYSLDVLCRYTT